MSVSSDVESLSSLLGRIASMAQAILESLPSGPVIRLKSSLLPLCDEFENLTNDLERLIESPLEPVIFESVIQDNQRFLSGISESAAEFLRNVRELLDLPWVFTEGGGSEAERARSEVKYHGLKVRDDCKSLIDRLKDFHSGEFSNLRHGHFISVVAYVGDDDDVVALPVFAAVDSLCDSLGFFRVGIADVQRGSVFRRYWAKLKETLTSKEAKARYVKAERALELVAFEGRQAEVNLKEAQAVATLVTSMAAIDNVCARVAGILVVKYTDETGRSVLLTRSLSQLEIEQLERYPEIQKNPSMALEMLALAVSNHKTSAIDSGDRES